jgi:hypothetical protein
LTARPLTATVAGMSGWEVFLQQLIIGLSNMEFETTFALN